MTHDLYTLLLFGVSALAIPPLWRLLHHQDRSPWWSLLAALPMTGLILCALVLARKEKA